jgi:NADH-ubiquinone oxidoreductase chain 2
MVIYSSLLLLLSNAVTLRRDKSILFSRVAITILLVSFLLSVESLDMRYLEKGIGLYGGLFHITANTQIFHMFIFLISAVILQLTAFYPRKIWSLQHSSLNKLLFNEFIYFKTKNKIINKWGEQFKIVEYPLIILFIIMGAIFLISTSDLVSIFLSIELQSYGLYLLSTLYRNSESATTGGLTYFLLGGLSSCFILLGTSLLYANSGTTNLEGLYIITSISDMVNDNTGNILYWYKPYYINFSLLIMSVGFLFKISAAPFHFWSPDVYDAIPTIVTTFVAIIAKISIFIFLLELVHYTNNSFFASQFTWTNSLLVSSLLSLIIGTIVGLTQFKIKKLYAYSTISHIGFILLALSINSIESIQAFIFYLMQYSISNLNAFFLLISIMN